MHFGTHIHRYVHSDSLLWTLVGLAFLLRVAGISYGLPLTLIADEPPFILGALQMLQSHTLVPSLHPELFKNILYYPPYLSYLYVLPFAAIAGATMATGKAHLTHSLHTSLLTFRRFLSQHASSVLHLAQHQYFLSIALHSRFLHHASLREALHFYLPQAFYIQGFP